MSVIIIIVEVLIFGVFQVFQYSLQNMKIMFQEKGFNTYCTHPTCVLNKNAFFVFSMDNPHVKQGHPYRPIHPMHYKSMCYPSDQNEKSDYSQLKNTFMGRVDSYIVKFCERISRFLQEKYLNEFINQARAALENSSFSDPNEVYFKLKNGDNNLLHQILSFESHSSSERQPVDFCRKRMIEVDKQIKQQLEKVYLTLEEIIQLSITHKDDFLKIARGQLPRLSPAARAEVIINLGSSTPQRKDKSLENQQNEGISTIDKTDIQSEAFPENIQKSQKRPAKTKKIQKSDTERKSPKEVQKPKQQSCWSSKSQTDMSYYDQKTKENEIVEINPYEIMIKKCKKAELTFEYIKTHYKQLRSLHIFCSQLTTKYFLRKILSELRNLQELTLNCNHDFQFQMLNDIPKERLELLRNFQLKWDFNRFFKEYQISHSFPERPAIERQRMKKVYIPGSFLQMIKKNQSMVLNSEREVEGLSNFNTIYIRNLHYYKPSDELLQRLQFSKRISNIPIKITSLLTLNISGITFPEEDYDFVNFLRANKSITTINISNCEINQRQLAYVFQCLKQLPNLVKLAFNPGAKPQVKAGNFIYPEWIFSLVQLQELYLTNVHFKWQQTSDNSGFKRISCLKKLVCLSLRSCSPICSQILSFIDPITLSNMEYLDLGLTQVNSQWLGSIHRMKKLQYLNIDQLPVSLKKLVYSFKEFRFYNQDYSPLKYLSMHKDKTSSSNSEDQINMAQMKELGELLPCLVYLGITNCDELAPYNFAEFRSLKTIAMNKETEANMTSIPSTIEKIYPRG